MPKLIIGCGRSKVVYSVDWEENTLDKKAVHPDRNHSDDDVTIDVDPLMHPEIVGDITQNETFASLGNSYFDSVFFEFIPGWVLEQQNFCAVTLKQCHRVMKMTGTILIMTGNISQGTENALLQQLATVGFTGAAKHPTQYKTYYAKK